MQKPGGRFLFMKMWTSFMRLRDGRGIIQNFGLRTISPETESAAGGMAGLFTFPGFCGKMIWGRGWSDEKDCYGHTVSLCCIFDCSIGLQMAGVIFGAAGICRISGLY